MESVRELADLYEAHEKIAHQWRKESPEGLPRVFEDLGKKAQDDRDALMRELYSVCCKREVGKWSCGQNLGILTRQKDIRVLQSKANANAPLSPWKNPDFRISESRVNPAGAFFTIIAPGHDRL